MGWRKVRLLSRMLLWPTRSAGRVLLGVSCTDRLCGSWLQSGVGVMCERTWEDPLQSLPPVKQGLSFCSKVQVSLYHDISYSRWVSTLGGSSSLYCWMKSGSFVPLVRTSVHTHTLRDTIRVNQANSQLLFKTLYVPFLFLCWGCRTELPMSTRTISFPVIQPFQNLTTFPRILLFLTATQSQDCITFAVWCRYLHTIKYTYTLIHSHKCLYRHDAITIHLWHGHAVSYCIFYLQTFINRILKIPKSN